MPPKPEIEHASPIEEFSLQKTQYQLNPETGTVDITRGGALTREEAYTKDSINPKETATHERLLRHIRAIFKEAGDYISDLLERQNNPKEPNKTKELWATRTATRHMGEIDPEVESTEQWVAGKAAVCAAREIAFLTLMAEQGIEGVPRILATRMGRLQKEDETTVPFVRFAIDRKGVDWRYAKFDSESDLIKASLQAATILGSIYDKLNIVHKDIKPHNLLSEPAKEGSNTVYVCDFGVSEKMGVDGKLRFGINTETLGFTPGFVAPEALGIIYNFTKDSMEPKFGTTYDVRSDIYSMALTIAYMRTKGRIPQDKGEYRKITKIEEQVEKPSTILYELQQAVNNSSISPELASFIFQNTCVIKEGRSPNWESFIKGLQAIDNGLNLDELRDLDIIDEWAIIKQPDPGERVTIETMGDFRPRAKMIQQRYSKIQEF